MTEIKQEALAHYDRMIEWAKKQDPRDFVDFVKMLFELGEAWGGEYCSYCFKYFQFAHHDCPLNTPTVKCHHCCNGLWSEMQNSLYWGDWVINAEAVREYINERG